MYSKYAEIRDSKGYTDNAVATGTGITQSTIYDWKQRAQENPKAGITANNLKKIAVFLGVTMDELMGD